MRAFTLQGDAMSATFWLISALIFGIVEACFPIAVFLFFALGALVTALAALAVQEPLWQAVCFVSMSLLSLVVARRRWRRIFGGTTVVAGESPEHPLEGRRGRLCEEISGNQPGVVEVGGSNVSGGENGHHVVFHIHSICGDLGRLGAWRRHWQAHVDGVHGGPLCRGFRFCREDVCHQERRRGLSDRGSIYLGGRIPLKQAMRRF